MKLHHATAKKFARNLIKAIVAVAQHNIDNDMAFVVPAGSGDEPKGMQGTLLKYREDYVPTISYKGTLSLDNGDEVAEVLRGLSPDEVCAIADTIYGVLPGSHWERWQHLNPGQRRMNAGNRIRGAVRRGEKTTDEIRKLVDGAGLR